MRNEDEINKAIELAKESFHDAENVFDRERARGQWYALKWVLSSSMSLKPSKSGSADSVNLQKEYKKT